MKSTPPSPSHQALSRDLERFRPYSGDPLLVGLFNIFGFRPFLIVGCYTFIGLGGVIALAVASGVATPTSPTLVELFEDTGELLNLGLIVPLGALLVFNFYNQFTQAVQRLMEDGVLVFTSIADRQSFLEELEDRLSKAWFAPVALAASLAINVWILVTLKNHWNSLDHGLVAIWFRFLSCINYYMVFMMLLKGVATTRAIRWIFRSDIILQPIHPDRCGGLQPLGAISGSLNVFLALLTSYITVLVEIEGIPLSHPGFLTSVLIFLLLATYLFIAPIAGIHVRMKEMRRGIQISLNREFQQCFQQVYQNLSQRTEVHIDSLHRLDTLEKLNRVAAKIPVWPIDMETVLKFFAVVGVPTLIGLTKTFLLPLFGI